MNTEYDQNRPLDWDKVAEYAEAMRGGDWNLENAPDLSGGSHGQVRLAQVLPSLESWRTVWRLGFVPSLSANGLSALYQALEADDPRLTQGSTTTPPPLMCVQDWPVEAACALGFAGWQGEGLHTVGEVEEYFARCCFEADQRLGEAAACRWFLNWFDDTPRDEMRAELMEEVHRAICERNGSVGATDLF